MLNSILYMMMVSTLTMIMMMLISMISKKSLIDKEKISPFECGFNSMSKKRLPFSIHFFLIATIFLIFDIEIIIIIPMVMTMKSSMLISWMITSISFLMILLLGLYHEWNNGMLNWTK